MQLSLCKQFNSKSLVKTLVASAIIVGGATFTPIASADTNCKFSTIKINGNKGAERPRMARGHKHWTGNHYVRYARYIGSRKMYKIVWYADNNGGRDGDTRDTFYKLSYCHRRP